MDIKINTDLSALASIATQATKFVYALEPTTQADEIPAGYTGSMIVRSINRIFTKQTRNESFVSGSALCSIVLNASNKELNVWVPIPVLAAVVLKNAAISVQNGKPYTDAAGKTVTRAQIFAPGTSITAADVIMMTTALMQTKAVTGNPPKVTATAETPEMPEMPKMAKA